MLSVTVFCVGLFAFMIAASTDSGRVALCGYVIFTAALIYGILG